VVKYEKAGGQFRPDTPLITAYGQPGESLMLRCLAILFIVGQSLCTAHAQSDVSRWKAEKLPSGEIGFSNLVVAKVAADKSGLMLLIPHYDSSSKAVEDERITVPFSRVRAWQVTGEPIETAALLQKLAEPSHVFAVEMPRSAKFAGVGDYHASILRPDSLVLYLAPGAIKSEKGSPAPARKAYKLGNTRDDNSLRLKMVYCPPGKFLMGSPSAEKDRDEDEDDTEGDGGSPVEVTLSKGFWIGQTEVTQEQWFDVMETKPWRKEFISQLPRIDAVDGNDVAVSYVSYLDAKAFCEKLTDREKAAGRLTDGEQYSLPTEAQWEYACRAGTKTRFSFGDDEKRLGDYAWWGGTIGKGNADPYEERHAHRVAQKKANPWKLYDMHGNCFEWGKDAYQPKLVGGNDPENTDGGTENEFVLRGGCWSYEPFMLRSASRFPSKPDERSNDTGFRVVKIDE
jgi:formylglycine-generating enzyme required for sulfatase activity